MCVLQLYPLAFLPVQSKSIINVKLFVFGVRTPNMCKDSSTTIWSAIYLVVTQSECTPLYQDDVANETTLKEVWCDGAVVASRTCQ